MESMNYLLHYLLRCPRRRVDDEIIVSHIMVVDTVVRHIAFSFGELTREGLLDGVLDGLVTIGGSTQSTRVTEYPPSTHARLDRQKYLKRVWYEVECKASVDHEVVIRLTDLPLTVVDKPVDRTTVRLADLIDLEDRYAAVDRELPQEVTCRVPSISELRSEELADGRFTRALVSRKRDNHNVCKGEIMYPWYANTPESKVLLREIFAKKEKKG